jgi:ABC-2 type transport system ATP-binding protein
VTLHLSATGEVERILAELRAAGVGVEDLQLIETDLEDVFLEIVGRTS